MNDLNRTKQNICVFKNIFVSIIIFVLCVSTHLNANITVGVSHITNKYDYTSETFNLCEFLKSSSIAQKSKISIVDNVAKSEYVVLGTVEQEFEKDDNYYTVSSHSELIFYKNAKLWRKFKLNWKGRIDIIVRKAIMEPLFKFIEDVFSREINNVQQVDLLHDNFILNEFQYSKETDYKFTNYDVGKKTGFSVLGGTYVDNSLDLEENTNYLELQFTLGGYFSPNDKLSSRLKFRHSFDFSYTKGKNSTYYSIAYNLGLSLYLSKIKPQFVITPFVRLGYINGTALLNYDYWTDNINISDIYVGFGASLQIGIVKFQLLKFSPILNENLSFAVGFEI